MGTDWVRVRTIEAKMLHRPNRGLTSWGHFLTPQKLSFGHFLVSKQGSAKTGRHEAAIESVGAGWSGRLAPVGLVFIVQHFGLTWFLAAGVGPFLGTGHCFSPPGPRNSLPSPSVNRKTKPPKTVN